MSLTRNILIATTIIVGLCVEWRVEPTSPPLPSPLPQALAQSVQDVTLTNVEIISDELTIRAPKIVFSSVNYDEARLRALFSTSDRKELSNRLMELTAKEIRIPELRFQIRFDRADLMSKLEWTSYEISMKDLSKGRVASYSARGGMFSIESSTKEEQADRAVETAASYEGDCALSDLDLALFASLFFVRTEESPIKPLVENATVTNFRMEGTSKTKDGTELARFKLSMRSLTVKASARPLTGKPLTFLNAASSIWAVASDSRRARQTQDGDSVERNKQFALALEGIAEILSSYAVKGEVEGIAFETSTKKPFFGSWTVNRLVLNGPDGSIEKVRAALKWPEANNLSSKFDLGALSWSGVSLQPTIHELRALIENSGRWRGYTDDWEASELLPTLGSWRLRDLLYVLQNDRRPLILCVLESADLAIKQQTHVLPSAARLESVNLLFDMGGLNAHLGEGSKHIDGTPISDPLPPASLESESRAVEFSLILDYAWNDKSKEFKLKEFVIGHPERGTATASADFANVSDALFLADQNSIRALFDTALRETTLEVKNQGGLNAALEAISANMKMPRSDLIFLVKQAILNNRTDRPDVVTLAEAVASFLAKPDHLTIRGKTRDLYKTKLVEILTVKTPADAISKLDWTVDAP